MITSKLKILIIIVSLIIILGVGYFGLKQYKISQQQRVELQILQENLQPDISSIVAQWRPRIVYIECEFRYSDGVLYATSAGSAFAAGALNFTNKHILIDENGYGPSICYIKYPDDDTFYEVMNNDMQAPYSEYDFAYLILGMNDNIINLNSSKYESCYLKKFFGNGVALIGDEIIILGYPTIGSQDDITVTRGIISGYDGDYYITDAKIEHGNSGGVAILLKDNCYLGIPSYTISGEAESLARILDGGVIRRETK
ncbi:MAG: hypothetical protein A2904_00100 [Candidatus Staskawiczbacteria bacterium RIFCSPLOWO2_01_FULL_33_9]|uniref:Serine protease n=1 Tax=Candidatus Staskawiczbacteria bacterium RIFCSPLOWO2_01_FULL_33_9 TaxID=1802211 RepID=A0A1G2I8G4_9BACT|nr:MAG: hypothetical protein A2904_00100 [Candidatus Staskawiczbacteria bacterium RIFCSPLOWO2_01_FULL_33_9]